MVVGKVVIIVDERRVVVLGRRESITPTGPSIFESASGHVNSSG